MISYPEFWKHHSMLLLVVVHLNDEKDIPLLEKAIDAFQERFNEFPNGLFKKICFAVSKHDPKANHSTGLDMVGSATLLRQYFKHIGAPRSWQVVEKPLEPLCVLPNVMIAEQKCQYTMFLSLRVMELLDLAVVERMLKVVADNPWKTATSYCAEGTMATRCAIVSNSLYAGAGGFDVARSFATSLCSTYGGVRVNKGLWLENMMLRACEVGLARRRSVEVVSADYREESLGFSNKVTSARNESRQDRITELYEQMSLSRSHYADLFV